MSHFLLSPAFYNFQFLFLKSNYADTFHLQFDLNRLDNMGEGRQIQGGGGDLIHQGIHLNEVLIGEVLLYIHLLYIKE